MMNGGEEVYKMNSSDFFNSPLFKAFNKRPTMDEFLALSRRFSRFGLTQDDIRDAIKSACDFFTIPQPRMIQDLTNTPGGQTMFVNWDRGSYMTMCCASICSNS